MSPVLHDSQISEDYALRRYRPGDRTGLRAICLQTLWAGGPLPPDLGDPWIWVEFWTRYFTHAEPEYTWVVEAASGRVLGYLTGTPNARRADRYAPRVLPAIAMRVWQQRLWRDPVARRALWASVRLLLRGDLAVPGHVAREFPGTLHMNLLPEARGKGLGRLLLGTFCAAMRRRAVPGIHVQTLSINHAAARFFESVGFHRLAAGPLRLAMHADSQAIQVWTWARRLA